ncbi:unnamed protein product [Lupinus luteus]|uniref:Uncharacterized protein n=1 Tax=Lupinus luteus TaxID=3873 RepID=A0AAV1XS88_LUPLU
MPVGYPIEMSVGLADKAKRGYVARPLVASGVEMGGFGRYGLVSRGSGLGLSGSGRAGSGGWLGLSGLVGGSPAIAVFGVGDWEEGVLRGVGNSRIGIGAGWC